ncbi:MAG TPA: aldo/keto reductase, partial [Thermodesulfobacteriota bacterium]|nr:aldo/keto reductase [Thermodesulfobacteriota bacterium]
AEGYGTENIVGKAVAGLRGRGFIATKVSGRHLGYDDVLRAAEESLSELGTDYIDLYQVHWPNASYPMRETMRAMEALVTRGMARFIGVSNFDVDELTEAQAALRHNQIVSNQVLYNLNEREIEEELLPYCLENGITILAYTPLDDGNLAARPRFMPSKRIRVLEEISRETGKTSAQVALNWCTSRENVVAIPKSDSVERTVENCGASGWRLSDAQLSLLDETF